MCGIAGIFYTDNQKKVEHFLLDRMISSLAHRGPDDRGFFIDRNLGIGFCRLNIIDLSPSGHQPMFNENGSICIICNGEIYNFQELRMLLQAKGHTFRSKTDVEVILHAYEEYGTDCLEQIDGMFSFAIWDAKKRELFLARDRFGIKPLYYYCRDGFFAFGSEIKAILCIPQVVRDMDYQAVWNYFSLMHIPAPQTVYKDIRKFLPSQAMIIKDGQMKRIWQYWDIKVREVNNRTEDEWIEELKDLFEKAVETHLVADVPVGCFLSGGIDSGAIVSFASRIKKEPIKTYSMSFIYDGKQFDESSMQRLVSDTFKTQHREIKVKPDILNAVDLLIKECDEPFAVPSAIGLYHLSRLASEEVKVVLSGDGGDELFAGYSYRYDRDNLFSWVNSCPTHAKKMLGHTTRLVPPKMETVPLFRKARRFLEYASMDEYHRYASILSIYINEEKLQIFNKDFIDNINKDIINEYYNESWRGLKLNRLNKRLYYEIKTSLADEMLAKLDRCTSMVSIEGRVPFLDRRFAECVMSIPPGLKYSASNGKKIFKKLLKGLMPDEILNGKKKGFDIPVNYWLANDREEIEYNKDFFDINYIKSLRRRYQRGDRRLGYHFWILKCFKVWEDMQV